MAVSLIRNENIYIGLSSDTKPTSALIGSCFYEYDTRNTYKTYDGTNWSSISPENVNLSTALSSSIDSINVSKMSHDAIVTALSAVTATTSSVAIAVGANGFKNIKLELLATAFSSGNFVVSVSGSESSAGIYGDIYRIKEDGTYSKVSDITISTNVKVTYIITNIAIAYIKITGTRTTDGTLTAKVTPFN